MVVSVKKHLTIPFRFFFCFFFFVFLELCPTCSLSSALVSLDKSNSVIFAQYNFHFNYNIIHIRNATFIATVTTFSRIMHTPFTHTRPCDSVSQPPDQFNLIPFCPFYISHTYISFLYGIIIFMHKHQQNYFSAITPPASTAIGQCTHAQHTHTYSMRSIWKKLVSLQ